MKEQLPYLHAINDYCLLNLTAPELSNLITHRFRHTSAEAISISVISNKLALTQGQRVLTIGSYFQRLGTDSQDSA